MSRCVSPTFLPISSSFGAPIRRSADVRWASRTRLWRRTTFSPGSYPGHFHVATAGPRTALDSPTPAGLSSPCPTRRLEACFSEGVHGHLMKLLGVDTARRAASPEERRHTRISLVASSMAPRRISWGPRVSSQAKGLPSICTRAARAASGTRRRRARGGPRPWRGARPSWPRSQRTSRRATG